MPVHGVDADFLPILILLPTVTVEQDLTDYIRELTKVLREASRTGQRYVSITPEFSGKVSATDRARIARAHQGLGNYPKEVILRSHVVISNPLMRGTVTALGWLMPDLLTNLQAAPTTEEAYENAMDSLRELGLTPPADLPGIEERLGIVKAIRHRVR